SVHSYLHSFPTRRSSDLEFEHYAAQQLPDSERGRVQSLATRFFSHYPLEELVGRRLSDVFGGLYQWWKFIQHFDSAQPKLRLFKDRKSTRLNSSHVKISY